MPVIALILVVAAIALLWLARRWRQSSGLPAGRVVYADPRAWGPVEKPLYAAQIGLVGKPDYLIQRGPVVIPVEVKTGRTPAIPPDAHIFQVAAYCLLVEENYHHRPEYGLLHYPRKTFQIDYTPELEATLLEILEEMRRAERRANVPRSHDEPGRCAGCGFRSICDQRME